MKRIGYTTGTFSDIHPGQIEFLKACKKILGGDDSLLIVGLVTDDLAVKQKRRASMSYRHRRAILQEFPFVDLVVSHQGDSKLAAHKKFKFNYVFIGEEYVGSQEYEDIAKLGVEVVYLPCPMAREFSSSALAVERIEYLAKQLRVLKCGTSGLVYLLDEKPEPIIIKTVRITHREAAGQPSENVYRMPIPPPRNFKESGVEHQYCNLPGVNGYREISIIPFIQHRPWCPIMDSKLVFQSPHSSEHPIPALPQDPGDWSFVHAEKSDACQIHFIYQRFCGNTLSHWISKWESEEGQDLDRIALRVQRVIDEIHRIIFEELVPSGIIHGDIHADNICVSLDPISKGPQPIIIPQEQQQQLEITMSLYLVDWGWCNHRSFVLDPLEHRDYIDQLSTGWDWIHFKHSLEYSFGDRSWYDRISIVE